MPPGIDDQGGQATGTEGPAAAASGAATDATAIPAYEEVAQDSVASFLLDAERSALYHHAREGFYSCCHRGTMFAVILLNSGAVASFAGSAETIAYVLALLAVVLTALDISVGYSVEARRHALLATRFMELAAELVQLDDSAESARRAAADIYRLVAEEPPPYHALNAICHNRVVDSVGGPSAKKIPVTRWQRWSKNLVRYSGTEFQIRRD